ncbi:MAG: hypothetical protein ACPG21_06805 [Crocinitomicaceae bacterium]
MAKASNLLRAKYAGKNPGLWLSDRDGRPDYGRVMGEEVWPKGGR